MTSNRWGESSKNGHTSDGSGWLQEEGGGGDPQKLDIWSYNWYKSY